MFDHSVYLSQCDGLVFERNVVQTATGGVKARRVSNSIFRGNTFRNMNAFGLHLGGDSTGGASNNRIERNLFHDNATDMIIKSESGTQVAPVGGLVIANNIMRSGTVGFAGADYDAHLIATNVPAQNVSVVNTLVYETEALDNDRGIVIQNGGTNILCANNLVGQLSSAAYQLDPAVTTASNLAYTGAAPFFSLGLVNPAGGDFRPTAASTALTDQGFNVSSVLANDYLKTARPQGPAFDIGPYERVP